MINELLAFISSQDKTRGMLIDFVMELQGCRKGTAIMETQILKKWGVFKNDNGVIYPDKVKVCDLL